MSLLIHIQDLLSGKIVEGTRMELKKSWNPELILRTICAFANDFENEGSGYIVIGVEDNHGKPVRPVFGFNPNDLEKVEKELLNYCYQIQPSYFPRISLEEIDGKNVLVIWCPAGANRPYKVPDNVLSKHKVYNYRIRFRSNSIVPNDEQTIELNYLTAKVPFDDRVNHFANVSDLSKSLMREHLEETKSKLYEESENISVQDLAEKMNLSQGANEHLFPKNVGLLMFSKKTQYYFKGAIIELVEFPNGLSKDFTEKIFTGTIQKQLVDALEYIKNNVIKTKVVKYSDREKADRFLNYPYDAIEEALANAVYHRNYELQDSIEIRILPHSIEIISFNGVDPSLKQSDFDKGRVRARRYRNSRVGEFLKELKLTEGRGTGIPTIINALKANGSPMPKFDTNEPERIHFIVEIPIQEAFVNAESDQVTDQVTDQVADQVTDQVKDLKNNKLGNKNASKKQNKNTKTDQVTDQVENESLSYSKALIEHLQKLSLFPLGFDVTEKNKEKYSELSKKLSSEQFKILSATKSPKSNKEIQEVILGLKTHTDNFKNHIEPLLERGLIQRTIPNKPTSRFQKYFTTEKGRIVIFILEQKSTI